MSKTVLNVHCMNTRILMMSENISWIKIVVHCIPSATIGCILFVLVMSIRLLGLYAGSIAA